MKKFILYLIRWQLSTPILALCLRCLNFSTVTNTIIANLIGGAIFFFVDRKIFKNKDAEEDSSKKCVTEEPIHDH